jgi:hypothetical protein
MAEMKGIYERPGIRYETQNVSVDFPTNVPYVSFKRTWEEGPASLTFRDHSVRTYPNLTRLPDLKVSDSPWQDIRTFNPNLTSARSMCVERCAGHTAYKSIDHTIPKDALACTDRCRKSGLQSSPTSYNSSIPVYSNTLNEHYCISLS